MRLLFAFLFCILSTTGYSQKKFNLDFEDGPISDLPKDWFKWGDYPISPDTLVFHSGEKSAKIEGNSKSSFGCIALRIPSKYVGRSISLEGYIKFENITDGHAGLLLRLDGDSRILEFDNMKSEQLSGTQDWQRYKVTLPYNTETETIVVGGILAGRGTAWFDGFKVTIDGKNIQTLREVEREKVRAELDKEFDEGSKITFPKITDEKLIVLVLLARIW